MQLNLLVISYIASATVSAAVAYVAWRRRATVAAASLERLMAAMTWWLVANAFEAASVDASAKVAWSVIAYPGIMAIPVLYLLFALSWTRQSSWLTRRRIALLFVVPAISVVVAATNDWHHLLWSSVTLIQAWGVTAVYAHGPWFWVEVVYGYAIVGVALLALLTAMTRYPGLAARRIGIALLASLAPVVNGLLYPLGIANSLHADLSSFTFAIAGVVCAWAVLRTGLLRLAPIAWATLVERLGDAVIVLDPEHHVAATNPTAARLLSLGSDVVGRPADDVLGAFPELAGACREQCDEERELLLHGAGGGAARDRWFSIRATPLDDGDGRGLGCLIVLHDVTDRRTALEQIRRLSLTDELTGLLNRRGFQALAEQQLRTSLRTGNRLWLLFADLDGLKDINDSLGHAAGDRAISQVADLLRASVFRDADLIARLGGDEFAVLATEISPADEHTFSERVRGALAKVNVDPAQAYGLSLSIGTAVFDPARPRTLDALLGEADERMYAVKRSRRATIGANAA